MDDDLQIGQADAEDDDGSVSEKVSSLRERGTMRIMRAAATP